MTVCEVCGNDYDKTIEVSVAGAAPRTFDSFECAVHPLAPSCDNCGCRVIGHGVETGNAVYCCANCARVAGEQGLQDRL